MKTKMEFVTGLFIKGVMTTNIGRKTGIVTQKRNMRTIAEIQSVILTNTKVQNPILVYAYVKQKI